MATNLNNGRGSTVVSPNDVIVPSINPEDNDDYTTPKKGAKVTDSEAPQIEVAENLKASGDDDKPEG